MSNTKKSELDVKEGYEVSKVVDVDFPEKTSKGKNFSQRQYYSKFALLRFDWPDSEMVVGNLCSYLTDAIKDGGVPVASKFINSAIDKYASIVFHDNARKCPDQARIGFFVEEIINEASRVEIRIYDESGAEWSIGSNLSFAQWLQDTQGCLSVKINEYSEAEREKVRLFIYEKITPPRIKGVLKRREYDKAVVRGCLSTLT